MRAGAVAAVIPLATGTFLGSFNFGAASVHGPASEHRAPSAASVASPFVRTPHSCPVGFRRRVLRRIVRRRVEVDGVWTIERRRVKYRVLCVRVPVGASPSPSHSSSGSFHPTLTRQWAGYFETPGPVTSVSGTWVVPSLNCSSTETLSSTWVGVGGLSSGSLLQVGMFDNCIDGVAENGGFAEQYPGSTVSFGLVIRPGDSVTATVSDGSGGWHATLTDLRTGQTEASRAPNYGGGSSAEWMAEAYGASGGVPVSNFGSERLRSFTVDGSPAQIPESDVYEMAHVVASDPASGTYRLDYS
ncbi:MAG: G1 family glutamic endopeptidase [Acidimicrobiales bacterium]